MKKINLKNNKTIFLYLDGFGYNYLKYSPFLKKLTKKSLYANLKTEPLHQFEFSIFSSKYQKNHNLIAWYYLNPKKSPFKSSKILKLLDNQKTRQLYTYLICLKRFFTGKTKFANIAKIPLDIAPKMANTVDKSFIDKNPTNNPTLFDVLRKNNLQYIAYEWPLKSTNKNIRLSPFTKTNKQLSDALIKNKNKDFLFAHFTILDSKMHRFGMYHKETIKEIKDLDNQIKRIYHNFPNTLFIVMSDHGMEQIKQALNIKSTLKKEKCLAFYDGDMVRIWTEDIKRIKSKLKTKAGTIYTKENMKKLGITYNRPYTGDILFLANPGTIILPNFFDGKTPSKAMHGYKSTKNQDALLIINHNKIKPTKLTNISIIEPIPTILKLLNLKIPKTMDGKPLL